jgi:DNA-binding response OmpR family regulator
MTLEKKRILLVDDEFAILKVLSIKLEICGYDVFTAADGQEALDKVNSAKPDLMLLDVIMPGLNGLEVLRRLRAFSELPVIIYSACPENAQGALEFGADDFIAKPLDVEDMMKRIERLLGQKS